MIIIKDDTIIVKDMEQGLAIVNTPIKLKGDENPKTRR